MTRSGQVPKAVCSQCLPGFQELARSAPSPAGAFTSSGTAAPPSSDGWFASDSRARRALDVRVSVSRRCNARTAARALCMGWLNWSSIALHLCSSTALPLCDGPSGRQSDSISYGLCLVTCLNLRGRAAPDAVPNGSWISGYSWRCWECGKAAGAAAPVRLLALCQQRQPRRTTTGTSPLSHVAPSAHLEDRTGRLLQRLSVLLRHVRCGYVPL